MLREQLTKERFAECKVAWIDRTAQSGIALCWRVASPLSRHSQLLDQPAEIVDHDDRFAFKAEVLDAMALAGCAQA